MRDISELIVKIKRQIAVVENRATTPGHDGAHVFEAVAELHKLATLALVVAARDAEVQL